MNKREVVNRYLENLSVRIRDIKVSFKHSGELVVCSFADFMKYKGILSFTVINVSSNYNGVSDDFAIELLVNSGEKVTLNLESESKFSADTRFFRSVDLAYKGNLMGKGLDFIISSRLSFVLLQELFSLVKITDFYIKNTNLLKKYHNYLIYTDISRNSDISYSIRYVTNSGYRYLNQISFE